MIELINNISAIWANNFFIYSMQTTIFLIFLFAVIALTNQRKLKLLNTYV